MGCDSSVLWGERKEQAGLESTAQALGQGAEQLPRGCLNGCTTEPHHHHPAVRCGAVCSGSPGGWVVPVACMTVSDSAMPNAADTKLALDAQRGCRMRRTRMPVSALRHCPPTRLRGCDSLACGRPNTSTADAPKEATR